MPDPHAGAPLHDGAVYGRWPRQPRCGVDALPERARADGQGVRHGDGAGLRRRLHAAHQDREGQYPGA